MNIKSLGYKSDFFFTKFDGEIIEKEDYFLIRSFSNPHFFWGNLLLFKKAPNKDSYKLWIEQFKSEFDEKKYYHITLAWDCPDGEVGTIEPFVNAGFEFENSVVLTTNTIVRPSKFNKSIEVKKVENEEDFKKCVEIQVKSSHGHLSVDSWREFYSSQMKLYRRMIKAGHGHWFMALRNGEIAGSLGVFSDKSVGRFQIVSTDPFHQRQGVCSSLVYNVAHYALEEMGLKTLVMVADEDYHAAKIYESVGFVATEKMVGLCWWDKHKHT